MATGLFYASVCAVVPLAVALLALLPAGLAWAAFRRPLGGLPGRAVRWCCVISMSFAGAYAALSVVAIVCSLVLEGVDWPVWEPLGMAAMLAFGLAATWRTWRWLALPAKPCYCPGGVR